MTGQLCRPVLSETEGAGPIQYQTGLMSFLRWGSIFPGETSGDLALSDPTRPFGTGKSESRGGTPNLE